MTNTRLNLLEVLRFIAALLVMLYHITIHYIETDYKFLGNIFKFGYSGVDIFFVLSGFIIFYSLNIKQYSAFDFISKRVIRILPSFWIFLFLPTLALQLFNLTDKFPHLLETVPMLKTLFLTFDHKQIGPSWTLSYELFFYLSVFIGLLIGENQKLLLILFILPLLYVFPINLDSGSFNFFTKPLILEFLIGIIVFKIYKKNVISKSNSILLFIISSLIFIFNGVMLGIISDNYPLLMGRLLLFGLPSGGIILGLISLERHCQIKVQPFMILLGSSSYLMYLIHSYIVAPIDKLALNQLSNTFFINSISIFGALLVIFLSVLLYKNIEFPLIRFLNRKSKLYLTKNKRY